MIFWAFSAREISHLIPVKRFLYFVYRPQFCICALCGGHMQARPRPAGRSLHTCCLESRPGPHPPRPADGGGAHPWAALSSAFEFPSHRPQGRQGAHRPLLNNASQSAPPGCIGFQLARYALVDRPLRGQGKKILRRLARGKTQQS